MRKTLSDSAAGNLLGRSVVLIRRLMAIAVALMSIVPFPAAAGNGDISGTVDDNRLLNLGRFTLPRVFLYDHSGHLVPQDAWPADLSQLKSHAGSAFCCVSDQASPVSGGNPPPDCKRIVYGEDVRENFKGLTVRGKPIDYSDLPPHKYLIVDYFATWCSPCRKTQRELSKIRSRLSAKGYLIVTVDVSRLQQIEDIRNSRRGVSS